MSKVKSSDREPLDRARRRLLTKAVYVPPLILGIISLEQSGCAPAPSCNPQSCHPHNAPCNPDNCNPNVGCNPHP